jgi:hypothetical protein
MLYEAVGSMLFQVKIPSKKKKKKKEREGDRKGFRRKLKKR